MRHIKITAVEYKDLPFKRITPGTVQDTYDNFQKLNGFEARDLKFLPEIHPDHCYIFMSDCVIYLKTKKEGLVKLTVKAGAFVDLTAIPLRTRLLFEHGTPYVIAASIILDLLYKTHHVSYDNANYIFKDIVRLEGANWWETRAAYKDVTSKVGRIFYDRYNVSQDDYRKYVTIKWGV